MESKLIKKFIDNLKGHPIYSFDGPYSLITCATFWMPEESEYLLMINKGRHSFFAVDEHSYFGYAENMFRNFIENKITIQELKQTYNSLDNEIETFYEHVYKDSLKNKTDVELATWSHNAAQLLGELITKTLYIETFDISIAQKVLGEEKKSVIESIWEQGTHPAFISFEGRRLKTILDTLKNIPDKETQIKKLKYVYTDYFFTKSESEIAATLSEYSLKKDFYTKESEDIEIAFKDSQNTHKTWINSLTDEQKRIVDYIQFVMEQRDIRKDPIARLQTIACDVGTELALRADIPLEVITTLSPFEFGKGVDWLKQNKIDLMKRKDGFVAIQYFDTELEYEFGEYDNLKKQFDSYIFNQEHENILKGQIACKGIVRGKVRIILDPHKDNTFEDGDILVTSMTRPEFVPLMKRAGAVITNEGGITCHAAIVSRELNIPCIIGTKNATHILKDEDFVEVDAEKGIIYKL